MGLFDKPRKLADIYVKIRNQALFINPVQIGLRPDDANPIFGILMETGYKDAVVTLSAMGEGSVSLYFSNGGGIIGLGEYEGPRTVCLSFLEYAKQFTSYMKPAKEFSLPQTGHNFLFSNNQWFAHIQC